MKRSKDRYSKFVGWAKVTLPIAGLVLLSTMFLFSGKVDVTDSLPYTTLNVEQLIQEQRISNPYLEGQTTNGKSFTVTASYAKPDQENAQSFFAENLAVTITDDTIGTGIEMLSDSGQISQDRIVFEGGIMAQLGDDLSISAQSLEIDLQKLTILSQEPLTMKSNFGTFDSNSVYADISGAKPVVQFPDGVEMRYQPVN